MASNERALKLAEIARAVGGELNGDGNLLILRPVPATESDPNGLAFAESDAYVAAAESARVGAVLVPSGTGLLRVPSIEVESPRLAFGWVLAAFERRPESASGVSKMAFVHPEATVEADVSIGPNCFMAADARICAGSRIEHGCTIGPGCVVGEGSTLHPGVVLVQDVRLGARCEIQAGATLGSEGFGYMWDGERQVRIPQVGGVILGDDCRIGSQTCIDRATCGDTKLGDGVKVDNLVQIAHNVTVGDHTVIAAHVGISGSVRIGKRCTVGGGCAFSHGASIADDVVLGGWTGVVGSVKKAGEYWGLPAKPVREEMRIKALQRRLPDFQKRLQELEGDR